MINLLLHWCLKVLLFVSISHSSDAKTVLLFGSSGAVGSEVLRALINKNNDDSQYSNNFWDKIILVGRRFPEIDLHEDDPQKVIKIQMASLENIDEHNAQSELIDEADACIIAVGLGDPMNTNLSFWNSVEIEMVGAMARMCRQQLGARYISLLSSVDAEENPVPLGEEDFLSAGDSPLGWWKMVMMYARMKGLSELAVINNFTPLSSLSNSAETHSHEIQTHISVMQPCNIVTETTRYGWFDWFVFLIHPRLDPYLPSKYHSIHVRLLGITMAKDAEDTLQSLEEETNENDGKKPSGMKKATVVRRLYDDFVRIGGNRFTKIKHEVTGFHWEL